MQSSNGKESSVLQIFLPRGRGKHLIKLDQIKQLNEVVAHIGLGDRVWLIPASTNSLRQITEYEVLNFSYSEIGFRIGLGVIKKKKGSESFYSASPEMFGTSIFLTKEEAEMTHNEIERRDNKL